MCLEVKLNLHIGFQPKPFEAPYDILVWKILKTKSDNCIYTPYQNEHLNCWVNGCCTLDSFLGLAWDYDRYVVNEGIHAYYGKREAIGHSNYLSTRDLMSGIKYNVYNVYPAIIPCGTKFFIGHYYEIAAEKMDIYIDERYAKKETHPLEEFISEIEEKKKNETLDEIIKELDELK